MKALIAALGMLLSVAMAQPLYAIEFKNIVAFGDSLSDVGNVAGLTDAGTAPVIDGYYEETHFSDNIIWVERLAQYWGLPDPSPGRGNSTSLTPEPKGTIWAWGGSEAAKGSVQPDGVSEPIPNLLTQVRDYLKRNKPHRRTLYAVWSGADNLLVAEKFGPKAAFAAARSVIIAMRRLERRGARHIVVFNLPDLALTPKAQSSGKAVQAAAKLYSVMFNWRLNVGLRELRNSNRFKAKIYFVNAFQALNQIVDTVNSGRTYRPRFFVPGPRVRISDVTDEALTVYQDTGVFPTNYLFWDGVHPTTQGHQIVVGKVLQAIRRPWSGGGVTGF